MIIALLVVAFICVAGLVAYGVEYVPADRLVDSRERRQMQIAAERHDRHR